MEKILTLKEEVDDIIRKKSSDCECNPCKCSYETKDIYFQKLKDTLARFNKEHLRLDLLRIK